MSLKLSAGCKCCDTPTPVSEICICGDTVQMVLIFQDEAISVYSPSGTVAWDLDVADWEAKTALFGAPEYAQLCQVWRYGATVAPNEATSECKPSTRDMPDGWTWDDLVRSPTEAQCKAVYDSAKGGAGVDDPTGVVLLGVDVSGSMDLTTLGDGYSDFKDYLTSISVEWEQVLFTNERWVELTTDNYVDTVAGVTPEEVDINFTGLENGYNCDICEDLVGDFTLTDPIQLRDTGGRFTADGWYPVNWGTGGQYSARTADVPYGTTHACVWKYEADEGCSWTESVPRGDGFFTTMTYTFHWWGFLLARFRISDTDYKWRLIVLYELTLTCNDGFGGVVSRVNDGWYWEHGENNPKCTLSGLESWTSYFPSAAPLLEVYCDDTHEAEFSDWCDYTLVLNNVETA
tara:strand:+ start:2661 stop:3869 length:1209 start_codon:yes stop_codon:yes gene_type:complete